MFSNQPWIQEFESLPPDDQSKVIDFVHALSRKKAPAAVEAAHSDPFELIRDLAGIVKEGPSDLSVNSEHMQGYGS